MKLHLKPLVGAALLTATVVISTVSSVRAQSPPAQPAAGGTFAQRLEQRKAERNIQLAERDTDRIRGRCVTAQAKIRELQQSDGATVANRNKVYQRIDAKLWVIIGELKLAERDTFELEKERLELAKKASDFQALTANYLQTLDDMVVINCQADVVGFKALVETAKIYYSQIRSQSTDIRSYVVDHIKPNLASHASELQPKSSTQGDN